MNKRYYRLQSPTLRGLVPLDKLGAVAETGVFNDESGSYRSYGFSFKLDGCIEEIFAAGFVDAADAESERQRLLDGTDAIDDATPEPFEDLSFRSTLRPIIAATFDATKADGKPRYVVAHDDETFTVQDAPVTEVGRWHMVVHADLTVTVQQLIPHETAEALFASGALEPVDPHQPTRRIMRIEP